MNKVLRVTIAALATIVMAAVGAFSAPGASIARVGLARRCMSSVAVPSAGVVASAGCPPSLSSLDINLLLT